MASPPPVSQSPELISTQGSTGMSMEVGSPTSPVLHSPTSASTPATGPSPVPVCVPPPLKCLVTDRQPVHQMASETLILPEFLLILPEFRLPQRRL